MAITLVVNATKRSVDAEANTPLLYVLRNDFGLNGPKFGCGLAQCGACTVFLDGAPIRSCIATVGAAAGKQVTTIEGIRGEARLHAIQDAFIAEQAGQCGYCLNGMVMAAIALLAINPHPDDTEIRAALNGNLCRCGSHVRILRAVKRAAATIRGKPI